MKFWALGNSAFDASARAHCPEDNNKMLKEKTDRRHRIERIAGRDRVRTTRFVCVRVHE